MEHLWGAQAIAVRLGYRNPKSFYRAWRQGRVFAFRRRDPRDSRRILWYSNSELVSKSEIMQFRFQFEDFLAKQRAKEQAP